MNNLNNCIFCRIIAHKQAAEIVYQDNDVTAFKDIHPLTPVHILIAPNKHIPSINEITAGDQQIIGYLFSIAKDLAIQNGIDQSGYRLVINNGKDAGQSVSHIHVHLIGGKPMPVNFG